MNVVQAMNAVMKEVREVKKSQTANIPGQVFQYRGVDQVVVALSAAIRTHGLVIVPAAVESEHWVGQTTKGNAVNYSKVTVKYMIYGPDGDGEIPGQSVGEAMDSGDKSLSKAMSVAWRTFLLQTFHLPTNDPDPDSEGYEATPRTGGVPANYQAKEAAMSEWQDRIADLEGDRQGLLNLHKEAQKEKAGPAVLSLIVAAGNRAKAGGS
jgi:hypothetical protein